MDINIDEKLTSTEALTLENVNMKAMSLGEALNDLAQHTDENLMKLDHGIQYRDQNIAQSFQMISVGIAGIVGKMNAISEFLVEKLNMDAAQIQTNAIAHAEKIMEEQEKRIKEATDAALAEQEKESKLDIED